MRSVGVNCHVRMPSREGTGSGDGEFDRTVQESGASIVKEKSALRSGCSKQAKTRLASATSNCE